MLSNPSLFFVTLVSLDESVGSLEDPFYFVQKGLSSGERYWDKGGLLRVGKT